MSATAILGGAPEPFPIFGATRKDGTTPRKARNIGVDLRYLIEGIVAVDLLGREVTVYQADDELSPLILEGPRGTYVVMPMRV